MNKKRNLILLHENQTKLLITFKHGESKMKEKSRKIIDIWWKVGEQLMDDFCNEHFSIKIPMNWIWLFLTRLKTKTKEILKLLENLNF